MAPGASETLRSKGVFRAPQAPLQGRPQRLFSQAPLSAKRRFGFTSPQEDSLARSLNP